MRLKAWLPLVLQNTAPWMSDRDIAAGAPWDPELDEALSRSAFGIVCVTRENLDSTWLHFEAGALAKAVGQQARVCPYLLGMSPADLPKGPLTRFQAKAADATGTRDIINSINSVLGRAGVPTEDVERLLSFLWPSLESGLSSITPQSAEPLLPRDRAEVNEELLDGVRAANRGLAALAEAVIDIQTNMLRRMVLVDDEGRPVTMTVDSPVGGYNTPHLGYGRAGQYATVTDRFGTRPAGMQKGGQPALEPMPPLTDRKPKED